MTIFRFRTALALLLVIAGCSTQSEDDLARIAELEEEVEDLRANRAAEERGPLIQSPTDDPAPAYEGSLFDHDKEQIAAENEVARLRDENLRLERERLNRDIEDMFEK